MKKRLLTVAFLMGAWASYAQVGVGTTAPNKSSQLEIVAKDKGILIPQVPLKGSTDKTTIINGNVSSLLVWNTSNLADITPGYYYWHQNKWMRILDTDTLLELDSNTTNTSLKVVGDQLVLTDSEGNNVSIPLTSINLPTSLNNNGDGTYTYTSENGTTTTIDVPLDVINNFYDIINNGDVLQDLITVLGDTYVGGNVYYDGNQFTYVDETGNSHVINFENIVKANETITKLVNNNNGTYTYTNEAGDTVTIDVPADVINNFEDIITNTEVLNQVITHLTNTKVGGNVTYDGDKFTYVDENNVVRNITFEEIVKTNETITKLVNNNDGTYTYTNEAGDTVTIDVPADVINNFEDIITNTEVLNQVITHLTNTKVGGNVTYDGDKFTYVDENNVVRNITFEEIIKANETLTILNYNEITNVLTYKDEDGIDTIIDLNIGSITYDSNENRITYVDGNGQSTPLTLNQTSLIYDSLTKVLTYTDSKGIAHAIDLGALVAAHETVTTLVNNNDGTYTYTNEAGIAVKIDVPADVINNFEDIINEGDVQEVLNEYIINKVGGNVSYDGDDFYYVDNNGDLVKIDIIDKVVNNIKNEGDIYEEIINIINEKSDILIDNGNGTFTHTSVNGLPVTFNANTTNVTVLDGVYTFLNGNGDIITTINTNVDALDVTYNNTISGLTSENVKEAIDELANTIGTSKGDLIIGDGLEFTGGSTGIAKLLSDSSIQIADGGITTSKIAVKSVTAEKLDGGIGAEGRVGVADANGDVIYTSLEEVVQANETLTILAYNSTLNQLTYTDEDATPKVIDLNVGSIAYSATENEITYTDEKGIPTVLTLNETSLVYDDLTNVLTYTNSKGEAQTIDLGALVQANETLTILAYNSTLNQLIYTDEDTTPKVIDLNVGSIAYSATENEITYTDEKGIPTVLTLNETSLVYDDLTNVLTYTNSKGEAQTIDLGALVQANETLTILAYNSTLNQLTYTDEDTTPKVIDLNVGSIAYSATENEITYTDEKGIPTVLTLNETSLVYDDLTNVLTYTNSKGEAQTIDLEALVQANETLTILAYNSTLNQLTYTDEDTTPKVIDLNVGSIAYSATENEITYTDEKGIPTVLTLNETSLVYDDLTNVLTYTNSKGEAQTIDLEALVQANETLTILAYNSTLNQLTYTDEDATPKVIDLNVGSIAYSATENEITYTDEKGIPIVLTLNETSLVYDDLTNVLTYTNSKGEAQTIDLGALVQANETLTILAYNSTLNQLTYTDEDATPKVIDLNVGSIAYSATENEITYTNEKGIPTVLTLNETSLVYDNLTNVLTYTNSKGEAQTIDLGALVQANETLTILRDNGDGTFTYTNEDNVPVTFDANTTKVTTVGGIYTFTDGNGDIITTINTNANSIIFNNSTNGFSSTNVQAAIEELLSKINTVDGTKGNLTVTGGIAFTTGSDGANKLLANSSIEIANGGVTEVKLAPNSVTTTKIVDNAVTTSKIQGGVNGDILVTNGGDVKWMSMTDATTNVLSLSGNELTSTVNGVDSSVILSDVVTSTKGITSNNITVTGGLGATLTDVTLNVTAGSNGQVMVTKNGSTAWVDQSEIVPTTTNILELTGNNLVSTVNGVVTTPAVDLSKYLDNTDDQILRDFGIDGTNLSITIEDGNTVTVPLADIAAAVDTDEQQISTFSLTGNILKIVLERGGEKEVDLSALQITYLTDGINTTVTGDGTATNKYKVNISPEAIQANQLITVVEQGLGILVTPVTLDNTTTYTVATNPATIALNGDVTGNANATTLSKIQNKILEATNPSEGNVLVFEGDKWITKAPSVDVVNVTNGKNLTAAGNATTATIEVVTGGTGATLVETSLRVKAESISTSEIKNGTIKPEDIADAGANQVLVTGSDNKAIWVNQSTLEVTADNGLTKTLNNVQLGGTLLKATDITTSATNTLAIKGLDKTKTQGNDNNGVTQHLLAVDKNGDVVKALKAAMPKFFYMPSVLVPTAESQLGQAGVTFDNGTREGTINLYTIYSAQFGSPVMSSGGSLPVLPSSELDYHITYATSGVFTINSISSSGLLTYTVASGADINNGSFINIVFSVKED